MIKKYLSKNVKSWILLFMIVFFLLITIRQINAASIHVCEWTNDNNFCVESTDENFRAYGGCRQNYKDPFTTLDQVPNSNCKVGTCVPNGPGVCLAKKFKIECQRDNFGRWYDQQIDQVEDCQKGCCNIANSLCGIKEKKVCVQDLAHGNSNAYDNSITDEVACDNSCRSVDKGCCNKGDIFKFGTRENCNNGKFFADTLCRDVIGYNTVSHKYKSCGDGTENNDKYDVYWYDSSNQREEIAESCGKPNEPHYKICSDSDGKGGMDAICVSTSCVDECPDCSPGQFRTGESVCLNTLNSFYGNERKSKDLHNYILRCQYGTVVPDNTDSNREKICDQKIGEDGVYKAIFISNNYQKCHDCGDGSATDIAGYIPLIGPPIAAGAVLGLGNACYGKGEGWTLGIGDTCESQGACKYDHDFIWSPIGSCNPKYSPGNTIKCGECGKGGDRATNLCTKQECNSLGDCEFHPKYTSENVIATGGLAIGTCAAGWVTAQIACHNPFTALGCPAWASGAKQLCFHVGGPYALFWGIVGTVYGVGAATATADTYNPDDNIYDFSFNNQKKVKIGVALAVGNHILQNLTDEITLDRLSASEKDKKFFSEAATATLPIITKYSAEYLINFELTRIGEKLIADKVLSKFESYMAGKLTSAVMKGLVAKATVFLGFVSVSKSFQTGTCSAETAYNNNEHCGECGSGEGQWYCTRERCGVLGGTTNNCMFVANNGTAYGKCIQIPKNDFTQPKITDINIKFLDNTRGLLKETLKTDKLLEIQDKISWETYSYKLEVKTDKNSHCAFSNKKNNDIKNGASFDEDGYQSDHSIEINLTEADKIDGVTLYFKCEDLNGNKIDQTDDSSFASFKFEPRPDSSPPTIQKIIPRNYVLLPADKKNVDLTLIVYDGEGIQNDAEECRYDKSNSTNYDEYAGIFTKGNKIECQTTSSNNCREFTTRLPLTIDWGANITLNGRTIISYNLNINCKDKNGNVGFEPQSLVMMTTELFNLSINDPKENEQLYTRKPFINVTTTESTACNYTLNNREYVLDDRFGYEHIKTHNENLNEGQHTLKVKCNDLAGNEVPEQRNFEIIVDNKAPNIIRLYKTDTRLCVQLDGDGECRYAFKQIFPQKWGDGNGMTEDIRVINSYCAVLDENRVYYLACRDSWDNEMTATIYP